MGKYATMMRFSLARKIVMFPCGLPFTTLLSLFPLFSFFLCLSRPARLTLWRRPSRAGTAFVLFGLAKIFRSKIRNNNNQRFVIWFYVSSVTVFNGLNWKQFAVMTWNMPAFHLNCNPVFCLLCFVAVPPPNYVTQDN